MSRKIQFNTNRFYSKEGQIISAEEFGTPYNDIDWFDHEAEQYIIFEDHTRMIKGRIDFCRLSEDEIMANYDAGNYKQV